MPDRGPILLGESSNDEQDELHDLVDRAVAASADVNAALDLARDVGDSLPVPGSGRTAHLWSALASIAAVDLTVARTLEPHLDALAILDQAGRSPEPGTWGVFAAEGPGEPLRAEPVGDAYVLDGRKHWCSLGGSLDRALVSAHVGEERRLFAINLRQDGATAVPGTWVARGLAAVDSGPIDFAGATAYAVGEPGWYLDRPGFAWGGIGVAAVWFGGAVGIARRLLRSAGERLPDQVALVHLGAVDAALHAAASVLARAAHDVDTRRLNEADGWRAALRVREVVALTAEDVMSRAAHGLGPGPLATDEEHARRVADLLLYLRQWHAERDQAALGEHLLQHGTRGW